MSRLNCYVISLKLQDGRMLNIHCDAHDAEDAMRPLTALAIDRGYEGAYIQEIVSCDKNAECDCTVCLDGPRKERTISY